MISYQDLSKQLIEAEFKNDLFNYYKDEIPIWWFARDRVLTEIYKQMSQIDFMVGSSESLSVIEIFKKIMDSFRINRFSQSNILALSTSAARRYNDEKDFDIYFDYLSWTSFKDSYAVMETPDRQNHSNNPYTKKTYYGDYLALTGNIYRKLTPLLSKIFFNKELDNYCIRVFDSIKKYINCSVEYDTIQSIIRKEYAYAKVTIGIANRYLKRIKPKVILVECGSQPSHMCIQYAARKRGIPVLEIQHGTIIPNSIGYFFGITNLHQLEDSPFPDEILVYGEHFKNILSQNKFISDTNVKIIGNPYLWRLINNKKSDKMEGTILIATQAELVGFYVELIKNMLDKLDNKIIIKPHPKEIDRAEIYYKDFIDNPRVKVITSNIPIYECFKEADFHISVGSTTHLEAICFGLKDIIIKKGSFEKYIEYLIDEGIPLASTVDEVIGYIKSYPKIDRAYKYVNNNIYSLNINPIEITEKIISKYVN